MSIFLVLEQDNDETMRSHNSSDLIQNRTVDNDHYSREFNAEYSERVLPVSVIFGLTAVFGLLSNLTVIYVYGMKYKRCNFKYFLLVMGVIGVVQCSIMLPTQAAEMHYWFVFPESWLCRGSAYVFGYTVIACYFVLLLIAVDRFRKVCRPYGWQIQASTARNLCIMVSLAALIFALPPGIVSGHHRFVTSYRGYNVTLTVCGTDDIFENRQWAVSFLLICGGFPVSVVIIVTCVLYGLILKQFYSGGGLHIHSMYKNASTQVVNDLIVNQKSNGGSVSELVPKDSPKVPRNSPNTQTNTNTNTPIPVNNNQTQEKVSHSKSVRKVIQLCFKNSNTNTNNSTKSPESCVKRVLRTSGSSLSRRGVRNKIMRKTLIVLIITITCIVALILTFCLHLIAEDINHNALRVSQAKLLAFVIFHRGSFSIICALFPIVYGLRDPKFRRAVIHIFSRSAQIPSTPAQNIPSMNDDSRC